MPWVAVKCCIHLSPQSKCTQGRALEGQSDNCPCTRDCMKRVGSLVPHHLWFFFVFPAIACHLCCSVVWCCLILHECWSMRNLSSVSILKLLIMPCKTQETQGMCDLLVNQAIDDRPMWWMLSCRLCCNLYIFFKFICIDYFSCEWCYRLQLFCPSSMFMGIQMMASSAHLSCENVKSITMYSVSSNLLLWCYFDRLRATWCIFTYSVQTLLQICRCQVSVALCVKYGSGVQCLMRDLCKNALSGKAQR